VRRGEEVGFAMDFPLEETGFEPSVPRKMPAFWPVSVSGSRRLSRRGKSGTDDMRRSLKRRLRRGTEGSNLVPSSGESAANRGSSRRCCGSRTAAGRLGQNPGQAGGARKLGAPR
jgi:hypothetical protein